MYRKGSRAEAILLDRLELSDLSSQDSKKSFLGHLVSEAHFRQLEPGPVPSGPLDSAKWLLVPLFHLSAHS